MESLLVHEDTGEHIALSLDSPLGKLRRAWKGGDYKVPENINLFASDPNFAKFLSNNVRTIAEKTKNSTYALHIAFQFLEKIGPGKAASEALLSEILYLAGEMNTEDANLASVQEATDIIIQAYFYPSSDNKPTRSSGSPGNETGGGAIHPVDPMI